MDIYLLYFLALFSVSLIYMSFKFEAPYLSVIAGIILIFLGIFMSVDGSITKTFCDVSNSTGDFICTTVTLPAFSFWSNFGIALGAMLMFLGVGIMIDVMLRVKGESNA